MFVYQRVSEFNFQPTIKVGISIGPAIERMLVSLILSWDNPSLWCQWIVLKMDLEDSHPIEHNSLVVINATPNP